MAMAVDNRQQMSGLSYEHMRYQAPQFTNPWVAASGASSGQMYATSMAQGVQSTHQTTPMAQAATTATMAYPAASLPALHNPSGAQNMDGTLLLGQDLRLQGYAARSYGADYASPATASSSTGFTPVTTASGYVGGDYPTAAQAHKFPPYASFQDRRVSHPLHAASEAERNSFSDALDASRGMVAMSQDITPRNIYGNQGSSRNSNDSYGFPTSHSAHSSISSATHPAYYGSSVSESSYGDYSSASESIDVPSRTLPRPSSLIGGALPPNQSQMMGQFSSKVSSSSQKKHKCKICEKRFTRPSSLQTHLYSHTGEKPYPCEVEGCGRHFSVVSNLRRHKKVHRGEADHPSPDDDD